MLTSSNRRLHEKLRRSNMECSNFKRRLIIMERCIGTLKARVRITKRRNERLICENKKLDLQMKRLQRTASSQTIQRKEIRDESTYQQAALNKIKSLNSQLKSYESDICELEAAINQQSVDRSIETKVGGKYTNEIRECVYLCARRQVPLHSISSVTGEISNAIFGKQLHPLPCTSSIGNMVNEMDVLAQQQAVEAMLHSDYMKLCWDATSIDSNHINEININRFRIFCFECTTFTRRNNSGLCGSHHFNFGIVGKNVRCKPRSQLRRCSFGS